MTKRQELEVLADAIAKLGPDSYLGPWLASVSGSVEHFIRADIFPDVTLEDCARLKADAKAEAKSILDKAHASAKDIIAAGHKTVEQDAIDHKRRFNAAVARAVEDLKGAAFYV